jgi:hypothetical protein
MRSIGSFEFKSEMESSGAVGEIVTAKFCGSWRFSICFNGSAMIVSVSGLPAISIPFQMGIVLMKP